MAVEILHYIGGVIKQANVFFDTYGVNGLQLKDGKVISFDDNSEKEYIGISDNVGTSFYIRSEPKITYINNERQISSLKKNNNAVKTCKLVAFSFKEGANINSESLTKKLINDLTKMTFSGLNMNKPQVTIKSSNNNYIDNYLEELKKKEVESSFKFVCVSINFELKYYDPECNDCAVVGGNPIFECNYEELPKPEFDCAGIENCPTILALKAEDESLQTQIDALIIGSVQSNWSQVNPAAPSYILNKPTNVSAFINDAGYITASAIPTNISTFVNDAGYITSASIPTSISAFTNDTGYITASSSDNLTNKTGNISQWTNDAGYLTSVTTPNLQAVLTAGSNITSNASINGYFNFQFGNTSILNQFNVYTETSIFLRSFAIGDHKHSMTFNTTGILLSLDDDNGSPVNTFNFTPYGSITSENLTAKALIKSGGSATQFLKADGTVDSSVYITSSALTPYELLVNKATSFSTLNNTLYPTTLAVSNYIASFNYLTASAIGVTVQGYSANTTILGNSTTGSGSNIVLGTSPTFVTNITAPLIYGGSAVGSTLSIQGTSGNGTSSVAAINFLVGNNGGTNALQILNNGFVGLGTSPLSDLDIKKSASNVVLNVQNTLSTGISSINVTGNDNIVFSNLAVFNTAGGVGTFYDNNTAGLSTNSTLSFLINERVGGGWVITAGGYGSGSEMVRILPLATTGAVTAFSFKAKNNTSQTASTNIPSYLFSTPTRQYLNGAIALQEEVRITAPVYSHVSGSNTITTAGTLNVYAPTTSGGFTNITNNYAIISNGAVQIQTGSMASQGIVIRDLIGSATQSAIYMTVSPTSTNYAMRGDSSGNTFINGGQVFLSTSGTSRVIVGQSTIQYLNATAASSGATINYSFTAANHTGQTPSTAIPGWTVASYTRTWATGNITTQIENDWNAVSYAFAATSTITTAYGNMFRAPIAGTLATITNNYAAGFSGHIALIDTFGIKFGTTTGGKIGLTTGDKIGFWNATPIVQPASANQAAVSGTAGALYTSAEQQLINDLKTLVNQLRADLVSAGNIKGSA